MLRCTWTLGLLLALTLLSACDSAAKKESSGGSTAAVRTGVSPTTTATVAAKPKGPSRIEIPDFNVTIEAPDRTTVKDIAGVKLVKGPGLVASIHAPGAEAPKTVEDAKKSAQMTSPTNMKEEKLHDGWIITYEGKIEEGKTGFFVESRREIAGKPIGCGSTTKSADEQKATVAACKSLKPKG